jgi:hypothetical protein
MVKILIFFVLMFVAFGSSAYMIYGKYKNTLHGKPEDRSDQPGERWKYFLTNVVGQDKVLQDPISGISHVFLMWGFVVLGFGAVNLAVEGLFNVPVPLIGDNRLFISMKDLFLLLVYVGVFGALLRRTVLKPARIENTVEAFVILGLVCVIVTGDLLYSGASFALGERAGIRSAAFFGNYVSGMLAGNSPEGLHSLASSAW